MPPSDPVWKKKTRPCPFYSQGRCLFADSCNFLHDVRITVTTVPNALARGRLPRHSPSYGTPPVPTVTVQSPASVHTPPRSPRMAGLLSILEDIIGPDDLSLSDENEMCSGQNVFPAMDSDGNIRPGVGQLTPETELDDVTRLTSKPECGQVPDDQGLVASMSPVLLDGNGHSVAVQDVPVTNRSRHRPTSLRLSHHGRVRDHKVQPDDDQVKQLDLLSPVELIHGSPLRVPFPTHPASDLGGVQNREDSIDSAFSDNWAGPVPLALSPPQLHPSSTLDLLASPFGSPSRRMFPPGLSPSLQPAQVLPVRSSSQGSLESIDNEGALHSTHHRSTKHSLSPVSSVDIRSDSFELIRPRSSKASDSAKLSTQFTTSVAQSVVTDLDIMPRDDGPLAHRTSHDQPMHSTSTDLCCSPESVPLLRPSAGERAPQTPSFMARFSLARVMKDSLVTRLSTGVVNANLVDKSQDEDEVAVLEYAISSGSYDHSIDITNNLAPVQSTSSLHGPVLGQSPPHLCGHQLMTPVTPEQNLSRSTLESKEDSFTMMYDSYILSPEQAAAKRMSWATSRAISPASDERSSHSAPPFRKMNTPMTNSTLSFSALDEFDRVCEEEMALFDSTGGGSRARVRTSLSSSRTGSCASSSSPSTANRSSAFIQTGESGQPGLSHSHSISREKGKNRDLSTLGPVASVRSGSSTERARPRPRDWTSLRVNKVPFGFRNSIKGEPSRSRSRLVIRTSDLSSPKHVPIPSDVSASLENEQIRSSMGLRPLRLSRILDPASSAQDNDVRGKYSPPFSAPLLHFSSSHSTSIPNSRIKHSIHDSITTNSPFDSHPPPLLAPLELQHPSGASSRRPVINNISRPSTTHSESIPTVPEATGSSVDDHDEKRSHHLNTMEAVSHTLPSPSDTRYSTLTQVPNLMFAIASDDPEAVRSVLERGEAGPNDDVGPQSALAFALTSDQLVHRVEIVKTLLAHGADPDALRDPARNPPHRHDAERDGMFVSPPSATVPELMDPATRYFLKRAGAQRTRRSSALIQRSHFRPLARARYDVIGQDRVFEQLFLTLNQRSRTTSVAPIVVLLCGPSGHGKSLLARKFASLLDVPAHTVNVTTLRSTHDIWQSYSMSPYEDSSPHTLSQFLLDNEGKRCVVVLDEIEKANDPKVLHSLLMPWELGRCSLKAGEQHVDVRNVIWIGTSNIGHDLVLSFEPTALGTDCSMSRSDYLKLTDQLRPKVSDYLGASLVSRITTILPFIPFTDDEKMALAAEALYTVGGTAIAKMDADMIESASRDVLERYIPSEGVRSLYRAASTVFFQIHDGEVVD